MSDDTADSPATDDQLEWLELVRAARDQMLRIVPLMEGMNAAELSSFVSAMETLQGLHYRVATFDKNVELSLARVLYTD